MATTDDRPASVYDNLNVILPPTAAQCSTPKSPTTATMNTSTTTTSTTSPSPYTDISFKFDATKSKQNQHQAQPTNAANASNQSSINASPPVHYTPNNTTNGSPYSQVNKTASQTTRPLSQHSDTNGYSGIAAVRAALNDAKSKFFGLNGTSNSDEIDAEDESLVQPDLKPKIQPKPQPKYQNIPENSAIFRSAQTSTPSPPPPPSPPQQQQPQQQQRVSPVMDDRNPDTSRPSTAYSSNSSPVSSTGPNSKYKDPPNSVQYSTIPLKPIDMDFSMSSQPSQAVYMATTVPQNIKGSKIAGRHTPTRNSLRHSRMLVVNKSYQGTSYPNPMGFRCPRLTRILLILEVIAGILTTLLGAWIFMLAPHTDIQDNPYWSGLALLLAGVVGLVLVRFKRIKRHKVREKCFVFVKLDSYFLTLLAALLCLIAFVCAAIHMSRLSATDTKCISSDILHEQAACQCTFNTNSIVASNGTLSDLNPPPDNSYSFHYRDLSCSEVNGVWMSILGFSLLLNSVGFILAVFYLIMLLFFRHRKVYTSVQTSVF